MIKSKIFTTKTNFVTETRLVKNCGIPSDNGEYCDKKKSMVGFESCEVSFLTVILWICHPRKVKKIIHQKPHFILFSIESTCDHY